MKSYLLILFLLLGSIAGTQAQVTANQPDPLRLCDDEASGSPFDEISIFDLTITEAQVIGGQDPTNLEIGFFESLADATNNTNAILDPTAYSNLLNPQSIFIRLTNVVTTEFDTTNVTLIVYPLPTPISPTPLEVCDTNNDGIGEFDLNSKDAEILGGQADASVLYFETLADAENGNPGMALASPYINIVPFFQTVYARVTFDVPPAQLPCYEIVVLDLIVLPIPDQPTADLLDPFIVCSDNGTAIFDLTINVPPIIGSQDPAEINVGFYTSLSDAVNEINTILDPQAYFSSGETIWYRSENLVSGCFRVGSFELEVETGCPIIDTEPENIFIDEGDGDGLAIFDLTIYESQMLGSQDPLVFLFSYYTAIEDAIAFTNAIATPVAYQNISNPQTIYVRLTNDNTGTFVLTSFQIETDGVLGLLDPEALSFSLAPIPAASNIVVSGLDVNLAYQLELFDMQGRGIRMLQIQNTSQVILGMEDLAAGMYFIKLISEEKSNSKRVIKQ